MSMFRKASKAQAKLRMALSGPPGSGKTYTALTIAKELGSSIALVDTERGSSEKYAEDVASFDVVQLETFSIKNYITAIQGAAHEHFDVLIIDSLSHAWMGEGGVMDEIDKRGGKFDAWRHVTPQQRKLIDTILGYPGHVIITMRSKVDYQVDTTERNGRKETVVRKLGLAPVQRDDVAYEFDIVGDMNDSNAMTVSKSRCPGLAGAIIRHPGKELAETIKAWLGQGRPAEQPKPAQTTEAVAQTGSDREPTAPNLDGYGIAIPLSACPIVPAGKQNAGKRWDQLPRWLLEKMSAEHRDRMSAVQREWIDYLVAHHAERKRQEAAAAVEQVERTIAREQAIAMAAEAGFVPDDGEAAPHAEAGCGADPADGEAAQ